MYDGLEGKGKEGGLWPLDNSIFTTQYVSGMANEGSCEISLYHRP